jgi:hypothetical protein
VAHCSEDFQKERSATSLRVTSYKSCVIKLTQGKIAGVAGGTSLDSRKKPETEWRKRDLVGAKLGNFVPGRVGGMFLVNMHLGTSSFNK